MHLCAQKTKQRRYLEVLVRCDLGRSANDPFVSMYLAIVQGMNVTGELGIRLEHGERKRPTLVRGALDGVQCTAVAAGGMHAVALTTDARVFTWGCNDEYALGRSRAGEDPVLMPRLL